MKRIMFGLVSLTILAILGLSPSGEPQRVSAGGWPCFLCHGGFEVTGTDLAPALAGSKLTDEQIIAQVRHPRGMMPAFSKEELPDQLLKDGFIQPFIRGLPAGKPTATLAPEIRSLALATISAVAAARATTTLREPMSSSIAPSMTPTLLAPSPTPRAGIPMAALQSNPTTNADTHAETPADSSLNLYFLLGGLLVTGAGVWWMYSKR